MNRCQPAADVTQHSALRAAGGMAYAQQRGSGLPSTYLQELRGGTTGTARAQYQTGKRDAGVLTFSFHFSPSSISGAA